MMFAAFFVIGCGGDKTDAPIGDGNKEDQGVQEQMDESNESSESSDESTGIESLDDFSKAVEELENAFNQEGAAEPVDFRALKDLLPEDAAGLPRTESSGEKNSGMGFKMSKAEAEYQNEDKSKQIDLVITDLGSFSGLAALAGYSWAMVEIDRESDTEWERTGEYKGYKSYEKYNTEQNRGEFTVVVANRFIIEMNGDGASMDEMKTTFDEIDLDELESMKDFGKEETSTEK
jgi:hypothetical protein